MSIKTDVSLPYESKYGYQVEPRLYVISAAPDSKDHALCREFYRSCDKQFSDRDDYTPYAGWMPGETAESLQEKRFLLVIVTD